MPDASLHFASGASKHAKLTAGEPDAPKCRGRFRNLPPWMSAAEACFAYPITNSFLAAKHPFFGCQRSFLNASVLCLPHTKYAHLR